jgi:REP element-mobilizing transposase RayT
MGHARKSLVCLEATPYYHVIARCVRRAWLWGFDAYAGKDYSHRKTWVLERLRFLSSIFAIDLCAYAVMSNHYHLVVHVDRARARSWSREAVVTCWEQLFAVPPLVARWRDGIADQSEREVAEALIERWRARLSDVSWYMRCLNEHLARRANAEDQCTGRFWEGRFKSQALLDEAGLLTAMAYVDLNPLRAGIAGTPEESEFTSIYARLQRTQAAGSSPSNAPALLAFHDDASAETPRLPLAFLDYLQLLDYTGRVVRADKTGAIAPSAPPILTRLNIDPDAWAQAMRPKGNVFGRALGQLDHLHLHARALGQSWIKGVQQAERLYRSV